MSNAVAFVHRRVKSRGIQPPGIQRGPLHPTPHSGPGNLRDPDPVPRIRVYKMQLTREFHLTRIGAFAALSAGFNPPVR